MLSMLVTPDQLRKDIIARVMDQPDATEVAVGFLLRKQANLCPDGKPLDTMLFMGPTGVGKTEMALAIAAVGFDGLMSRFDMSEYGTMDTMGAFVDRVIKLDDAPQILLFDEIEKANSVILKLLLQILDTAHLRCPSTGREKELGSCLVIGTSNVASAELATLNHTSHDQMSKFVLTKASSFFAPEVLARWKHKVVFQVLQPSTQRKLCENKVSKESDFIAARTGVRVIAHTTLIDYLNEHGIDRVYGARPLLQMVERILCGLIAESLAMGKVRSGKTVHIGVMPDGSIGIGTPDTFGRIRKKSSLKDMLGGEAA